MVWVLDGFTYVLLSNPHSDFPVELVGSFGDVFRGNLCQSSTP